MCLKPTRHEAFQFDGAAGRVATVWRVRFGHLKNEGERSAASRLDNCPCGGGRVRPIDLASYSSGGWLRSCSRRVCCHDIVIPRLRSSPQ